MDRVNTATHECLSALGQLRRESGANLPPEALYARVREYIDRFLARARELKFSEEDVLEMGYAMVALADEVAQRKSPAIASFWMGQPLQMHYFNENLAGEGFFDRLSAMLADPGRKEVVRVYYLCLLFGMRGRYAVRGGELELDAFIKRTRGYLKSELRREDLAPRGVRPPDLSGAGRRPFPAVWVGAFSLVFAMALLVTMKIALNGQTTAIIGEVPELSSPKTGDAKAKTEGDSAPKKEESD